MDPAALVSTSHKACVCLHTEKFITAEETSKLSFCLQICALGALRTAVFLLWAALISIGSHSICQITPAGLCRAHCNIGLEPRRGGKKTTRMLGNECYREAFHFPFPFEDDGHNRYPDNTRTSGVIWDAHFGRFILADCSSVAVLLSFSLTVLCQLCVCVCETFSSPLVCGGTLIITDPPQFPSLPRWVVASQLLTCHSLCPSTSVSVVDSRRLT